MKDLLTPTERPRSTSTTALAGRRGAWFHKAPSRGSWTWTERKRQFRAVVPAAQCTTLCETLQRWGTSPDDVEPLLRLVKDIVVSNAVHRAAMKRAKWAAGRARDPHYKKTREDSGVLRPVLKIIERVVLDLKRLSHWEFTPPIVLHEFDARLNPTRRTVRLSRFDEALCEVFNKAEQELLYVREILRTDTQRVRGRKTTLVQPFRVSAGFRSPERPKPARRRELMRMVSAQLLVLHPERKTRARVVARAEAGRLAADLVDSIPLLN